MRFAPYFEVETADNGYVALQKVKQKEDPNYFDLIILDINMPISNGFDACSKICTYFASSALNSSPDLLQDFEQKIQPIAFHSQIDSH